MMIRRNILCAIMMCAFSISAMALPTHDPVVFAGFELIDEAFSANQAYVTSQVYQLDPVSGGFLYTYQISIAQNPGGDPLKFSWFSVALNPGTSILDQGWELSGTTPLIWETVVDESDNPISIEAFFKKGLTFSSGDSALLWFTSPNGPDPVYGWGALSQNSGGSTILADGFVLVPTVPEPTTIALLGLGWLASRSYKRKG